MNKKISTGYLTPQTKRLKTKPTRRSETSQNVNMPNAQDLLSDSFFDKLMKDPIKKQLVLQLISGEEKAIAEYKRNEAKKLKQRGHVSPFQKLQKNVCESPTALYRRRALEQQKDSTDSASVSSDSRTSTSSKISLGASFTPVPTEKLLQGVIAYVEVNSKNQDRSAGAKTLMMSMGATIRDTFDRYVTHVVFKDGSYSTYQKAKLRKVHLVSVLWIEATRRHNCRVSEMNYPALGSENYTKNVSVICSQLQKEYEEVVRDEVRRTLDAGTSLPTTKSLIESGRRRTVATPLFTSTQSSISADSEIKSILTKDNGRGSPESGIFRISPIVTSDESDCGGIIDGVVTKYKNNSVMLSKQKVNTSKVLQSMENYCNSDMEITENVSEKKDDQTNSTENSKSLLSYVSIRKSKRQSLPANSQNSNENKIAKNSKLNQNKAGSLEDTTATFKKPAKSSIEIISRRRTCHVTNDNPVLTSDDSTNVSDSHFVQKPSKISKGSSEMSSLRLSASLKLKVGGKGEENDSSHTSVDKRGDSTGSSSGSTSGSDIKLSKRIRWKQASSPVSSTMSSLRLSSQMDKRNPSNKNQEISSSDNSKLSFSPVHTAIINEVIDSLDYSELPDDFYVTSRKKNIPEGDKGKLKRPMQDTPSKINSDEEATKDFEVTNGRKRKRFRKLFSPSDSCRISEMGEEEERTKSRTEKTNRLPVKSPLIAGSCSNSNVFINAKAKKFVDENEIELDNVLNTTSVIINTKKIDKKSKKKPRKELPAVGGSDDEQVDLANEFLKEPPEKTTRNVEERDILTGLRRSQRRRSMRVDLTQNTEPKVVNRRSTMEFQATSQSQSKRRRLNPPKQSTIVCTKMHTPEVEMFKQIVAKLGRFVVEDEVSKATTHLVAGEPKRTINMLRAISLGCWVLKEEWLLKSLEAGKWLPEEDFEVTDFSPAVQQCRLQRQAFGSSFKVDVFQNCGRIYITRGSTPRRSDLKELVVLCKGTVTTVLTQAAVVVGEYVEKYDDVTCVTEHWILDSITFNKTMPFKKYLLKEKRESMAV